MVRIRTLLSSVMALALLSSPTFAADDEKAAAVPKFTVNVRSSDKGDYSRIVFDWGAPPKYTVNQENNELLITFDKTARFLISGIPPNQLPRITGYKVVSSNTVGVSYEAGEDVRHFVIDNRLIIDVKDTQATKDKKNKEEKKAEAVKAPEENKPQNKELVELKNEEKKEPESIPEKAQEKSVEPTPLVADDAENKNEPEKKEEQKQDAIKQDAVISITGVETTSVVAFERSGYLWIVQDKPGLKILPQIKGMNVPTGFEAVPAETLSAFRLKLPDGMPTPVADGGGLVWKLIFKSAATETDKEKSAVKPTELKYKNPLPGHDENASVLWPAGSVNRIGELTDPDIGDKIIVTFVNSASQFSGDKKSFVDFNVLPSFIGMAIVPKSDDLNVTKTKDGALITRPDGLHISRDEDIVASVKKAAPEPVKDDEREISRIFDFLNWQMGTKSELSNNQRLVMAAMARQTDEKKTENLISLARLSLSFNYAPEAMGYLELAQNRVPDLDTNPEFMALHGLANALSWRFKDAYTDFSAAGLNDIDEIKYWRAYTLAKLDDWQQAAKTLPENVSIITTYPVDIRNPFALTLAEIALREGNTAKAKKILDILTPSRDGMDVPYAAAFDYLRGEYERQTGHMDEAKKLWSGLENGVDDLYRAKARFALTMLELGAKEITIDKAIDNLEGLRYAWRGDDLEVSINYNLAKAYLEKGEPLKALTMMKMAHALNPTSERGKQIDADMHDVFKRLFKPAEIQKLSPADALTVYNEFSDLAPPGAEGDALTRQLAERLVNADLLPRAIVMLKKQLSDGLSGDEGAAVAVRLAALQNMEGKADDALKTLKDAETMVKDLPASDVLSRQRDIGMLRANAYSMKGDTDDAFSSLALLPQDDDILRLRADIAWKGKKWQDAADALEQLVDSQEISLTRPLSDAQADLLLNWAVALYLADNRYVLANVRERYGDAMSATSKADKFDVVTRPRQAALLADRETINSIIDETVIFKDFLKSFKMPDVSAAPRTKIETKPANDAGEPSAKVPQGLKSIPGLKTDEVLGD